MRKGKYDYMVITNDWTLKCEKCGGILKLGILGPVPPKALTYFFKGFKEIHKLCLHRSE